MQHVKLASYTYKFSLIIENILIIYMRNLYKVRLNKNATTAYKGMK